MKRLAIFAAILVAGVCFAQRVPPSALKMNRSAAVTPGTAKLVYLATNGNFTFTAGKADVVITSATVNRTAGETQTWGHIANPKKFYVSGASEIQEYLVSAFASTAITLAYPYNEGSGNGKAYTVAEMKEITTIRAINRDDVNFASIYLIDTAGVVSSEAARVNSEDELTLWNVHALGVAYDAGQANDASSLTIELYEKD
jgi:hypothetical protein